VRFSQGSESKGLSKPASVGFAFISSLRSYAQLFSEQIILHPCLLWSNWNNLCVSWFERGAVRENAQVVSKFASWPVRSRLTIIIRSNVAQKKPLVKISFRWALRILWTVSPPRPGEYLAISREWVFFFSSRVFKHRMMDKYICISLSLPIWRPTRSEMVHRYLEARWKVEVPLRIGVPLHYTNVPVRMQIEVQLGWKLCDPMLWSPNISTSLLREIEQDSEAAFNTLKYLRHLKASYLGQDRTPNLLPRSNWILPDHEYDCMIMNESCFLSKRSSSAIRHINWIPEQNRYTTWVCIWVSTRYNYRTVR
jgi:hypothetical protein